jgi:hypothetical protein
MKHILFVLFSSFFLSAVSAQSKKAANLLTWYSAGGTEKPMGFQAKKVVINGSMDSTKKYGTTPSYNGYTDTKYIFFKSTGWGTSGQIGLIEVSDWNYLTGRKEKSFYNDILYLSNFENVGEADVYDLKNKGRNVGYIVIKSKELTLNFKSGFRSFKKNDIINYSGDFIRLR